MSLRRMKIFLDNNIQAFLELLRAGLWEKDAGLSQYKDIDLSSIMKLAEEQSVVGIVAAGIEHVCDIKPSKEMALKFIGQTLQLEQLNSAMNSFIGDLIWKLRAKDIYALLIKGQGVSQCYERPLWRSCGDVDLLLSKDNYNKAKSFLIPLATGIGEENIDRKHLALTIDSWVVELHGELPCEVSRRADAGVKEVKKSLFEGGEVRSWMNGNKQVFLPSSDNDAILVFTHILQHFFFGGIGLRQICDWCRLLWTYKDSIDKRLLEKRIRSMGLMTEWKAFAALAVNTLGMPVEAIPMYDTSRKWTRKADHILAFILETGNFGHNRDTSYFDNHSYFVSKAISFWRNTWDSMRHLGIFPVDATRVWFKRLAEGIRVAAKGK